MQHQIHGRPRPLGEGQIKIVDGRLDQAEILALPGHPDDLDRGTTGGVQAEAFADGALFGIVFAREKLVDNRDAWRI